MNSKYAWGVINVSKRNFQGGKETQHFFHSHFTPEGINTKKFTLKSYTKT